MWKGGVQKPGPPKHMPVHARRIWQAIVDDRPSDFFRPGALLLLEQLCCVMVAQRVALAQLAKQPDNPELIKAVKDYATIVNSTAVKLRLTTQADVERHSRKVDEKEAPPDVLLAGWKQSA
jgi:hypothetical protein